MFPTLPMSLRETVLSRRPEMFLEEGDETAALREALLGAVEYARQAAILEHDVEKLRQIVLED